MKRRNRNSGIDMSSLIDIVFILLIFVMLSISFQKRFQVLDMDLPNSQKGGSEINSEISISLKENGELYWNKELINVSELEIRIMPISGQNKKIQFNVEKRVVYEDFIKISEIIKKSGVEKVQLGLYEKK